MAQRKLWPVKHIAPQCPYMVAPSLPSYQSAVTANEGLQPYTWSRPVCPVDFCSSRKGSRLLIYIRPVNWRISCIRLALMEYARHLLEYILGPMWPMTAAGIDVAGPTYSAITINHWDNRESVCSSSNRVTVDSRSSSRAICRIPP